MGKIEPSVLGKIKGKVGNLVIYELNGQIVVRKIASKGNYVASDLQKYHQRVFSLVSKFLKPFKEELNFSMAEYEKGGKKGYHHGMGWFLKNGIQHGEIPQIRVEKLLVSMGSLSGPKNPSALRNGTNEVHVFWEPNAWDGSARESDKSYILLYDPIRFKVIAFRGGAYRKAGSQSLLIPWSMKPVDKLWIFLSFYRIQNKINNFSDSCCLGLL